MKNWLVSLWEKAREKINDSIIERLGKRNSGFIDPLISIRSLSPTLTPTPTPFPLYGRTEKFKRDIVVPQALENYKRLIKYLDKLNATTLEKELASDIFAQESSLGQFLRSSSPTSTAKGWFMFTNPTWQDYIKVYPEVGKKRLTQEDEVAATEAFLNIIRKGLMGIGLSRWDASRPVWGQAYTQEELSTFYP